METGIKSKLDYSDYLCAPEDGKSYEILQGNLYVSPPPSPYHQRASKQLQRQLEAYFEARKIGEVLSRSTRGRDRGVKANRYAELGIESYWIVDPVARSLECFIPTDGKYRRVARAQGDSTLRVPVWDGLEIDLGKLWRGIEAGNE